jgi:Excalibur calcium-binding domain
MPHTLAATNKCLPRRNKSRTRAETTKKRRRQRGAFLWRCQLARSRCGVCAAGLPRFEADMSWRREPVYLKKAKPLDGLFRERLARHDLPAPNPVRPGPGPEDRLRNLRRRFRAVSARHDRASKRRYYRSAKIAVLAAIVAFAVSWGLGSSPWSVMTTMRHVASAPNCGFARLVGLAPARRGEPGYWKRHDRDRDGIACEPWPPPPRGKK